MVEILGIILGAIFIFVGILSISFNLLCNYNKFVRLLLQIEDFDVFHELRSILVLFLLLYNPVIN